MENGKIKKEEEKERAAEKGVDFLMKKILLHIPSVFSFLFASSFSLHGQAPVFIPKLAPDSVFIENIDTLTYEQKLGKVCEFNTRLVKLAYSNPDTSACQLSLDTYFALPKNLVSAMIRDFRSDSLLPAVAEPLVSVNNGAIFRFGKITLKWNPGIKAFISEGSLPLLAIGGKAINKDVKGYVMVEYRRSGNILSIYLENGNGGWYMFHYSNRIMLACTSDENLNSKIAKHHVVTGKSSDPEYRCVLGSASERALLLKKVKRANA